MNMTWQEQDAIIRAAYQAMPTAACKGHCWRECFNIDMTIREREVIRRKYGIIIRKEKKQCPALDPYTHKCKVYDDRPLVCRVWGVAETIPCPWGCEVSGDPVTDEQWFFIGLRVQEAGGHLTITSEDRKASLDLYLTDEGRKLYETAQAYTRTEHERYYRELFTSRPELAPQEDAGDPEGTGTELAEETGEQCKPVLKAHDGGIPATHGERR